MTRIFDTRYAHRKIIDLSQQYSELQRLRDKVRSAEAKLNGMRLDDLVQAILKSHDQDLMSTRKKLTNYLRLLLSTDMNDKQLVVFGRAYVKELREPDSRYSGC